MQPIRPPLEDVLDLHHFNPREVPDLLEDYFAACIEAGISSVRIIHGKGRGFLKQRVIGLLEKNTAVAGFRPAPAGAGGWGATLVELNVKRPPSPDRDLARR